MGGGCETENFPKKRCANIGISIVTVGRLDEEIFRQAAGNVWWGSAALLASFNYATVLE